MDGHELESDAQLLGQDVGHFHVQPDELARVVEIGIGKAIDSEVADTENAALSNLGELRPRRVDERWCVRWLLMHHGWHPLSEQMHAGDDLIAVVLLLEKT